MTDKINFKKTLDSYRAPRHIRNLDPLLEPPAHSGHARRGRPIVLPVVLLVS